MTLRPRILPPRSTLLERNALEAGSRAFRVIDEVLPAVYQSKKEVIPDSWVPWLLVEYGLTRILPFIRDERRALEEGPEFVRKIGTPYAMRRVLEWLNYHNTIIEEEPLGPHWYEFQLGLDHVPDTMDDLARIVGGVKLAKPFTRRAARLYSGYDIRPFVWDDTVWDDEGLFDDYSGVIVRPDWPRISFGKTTEVRVTWQPGKPKVDFSIDDQAIFRAVYEDAFRWDESNWDDDYPPLADNNFFSVTEYFFEQSAKMPGAQRMLDIEMLSKAMVVFDDQWLWDDTNHTFAMFQTIEEGTDFIFDDAKWDIDGTNTRVEPIHETFFDDKFYAMSAVTYPTIDGTSSEITSFYYVPRETPLQFGFNVDSVSGDSAKYPARGDEWQDRPWQSASWSGQTTYTTRFDIQTTTAP